MIRSFCAVSLPLGIRRQLIDCIDQWRPIPLRAGWCRLEQLHITLTFHGDQPEQSLQDLMLLLPEAIREFSPFEVAINGIGFFGRENSPRVIWAVVKQGADRLMQLQQAVATAAEAAGIEMESRPYHPHVTMGRVRRADPDARRELMLALRSLENRNFAVVPIDQIALMRSELTSGGVNHSVLLTVPL